MILRNRQPNPGTKPTCPTWVAQKKCCKQREYCAKRWGGGGGWGMVTTTPTKVVFVDKIVVERREAKTFHSTIYVLLTLLLVAAALAFLFSFSLFLSLLTQLLSSCFAIWQKFCRNVTILYLNPWYRCTTTTTTTQ